MPQTKKSQIAAAARARAAKSWKKALCNIPSDLAIEQSEPDNNCNPDIECTGWTRGVNHVLSDTETDPDDEDWKNTDLDGEGCDYTFGTLKENMPKALASVSVKTIWKWEHQMKRWMEAYQGGLGAKQAQIQVRNFSSRCYTSHRRVPERIAALFDT